MLNSLYIKRLTIVIVFFIAMAAVFLIHALAGWNSKPVTFADPPEFVARYGAEMEYSDPLAVPDLPSAIGGEKGESKNVKLTADFSYHQALIHQRIFDGESHDEVLMLFTHPDKVQRVKMALALAAINIEFTHNEESGFAEKREQFWIDVEKHLPNIQNALSEALISSALEKTANRIPYTLAWMPGQNNETVELLAWAAKHHPDWWVRRFSVYFVVKFGGDESLAAPLLQNRIHDPDYRVRKQALELRINRFIGKK